MLIYLGMQFEGNQHCGLHDSRNIARITIHMIQDGWAIKLNEVLHEPRNERFIESDAEQLQNDNKEEIGSSQGDKTQVIKAPESDHESELAESIEKLTLVKDDSDEETDCVEDLLHYYRLQKS